MPAASQKSTRSLRPVKPPIRPRSAIARTGSNKKPLTRRKSNKSVVNSRPPRPPKSTKPKRVKTNPTAAAAGAGAGAGPNGAKTGSFMTRTLERIKHLASSCCNGGARSRGGDYFTSRGGGKRGGGGGPMCEFRGSKRFRKSPILLWLVLLLGLAVAVTLLATAAYAHHARARLLDSRDRVFFDVLFYTAAALLAVVAFWTYLRVFTAKGFGKGVVLASMLVAGFAFVTSLYPGIPVAMSIDKSYGGSTGDAKLIVAGISMLPPLSLLFIWLVAGILRSGENTFKFGA